MNSQATSNSSMPRFDVFLTAVENRRDNWQRLHGLAQARAAVPSDSDRRDAGRLHLFEECRQLLAQLEPLENCYAYPGPALMERLREKLAAGDVTAFADLARRLAKALLGGTFRRD